MATVISALSRQPTLEINSLACAADGVSLPAALAAGAAPLCGTAADVSGAMVALGEDTAFQQLAAAGSVTPNPGHLPGALALSYRAALTTASCQNPAGRGPGCPDGACEGCLFNCGPCFAAALQRRFCFDDMCRDDRRCMIIEELAFWPAARPQHARILVPCKMWSIEANHQTPTTVPKCLQRQP